MSWASLNWIDYTCIKHAKDDAQPPKNTTMKASEVKIWESGKHYELTMYSFFKNLNQNSFLSVAVQRQC